MTGWVSAGPRTLWQELREEIMVSPEEYWVQKATKGKAGLVEVTEWLLEYITPRKAK